MLLSYSYTVSIPSAVSLCPVLDTLPTVRHQLLQSTTCCFVTLPQIRKQQLTENQVIQQHRMFLLQMTLSILPYLSSGLVRMNLTEYRKLNIPYLNSCSIRIPPLTPNTVCELCIIYSIGVFYCKWKHFFHSHRKVFIYFQQSIFESRKWIIENRTLP